MNISFEFSKVKDSFFRVKEDMLAIKDKINENYDNFLREHRTLTNRVEVISIDVKNIIEHLREKHDKSNIVIESKEILDIKDEIVKLKSSINDTINKNHEIHKDIEYSSKNREDIKSLNHRVHNSELEMHLLKGRMIEKDMEIKQMKEINSHMLTLLDELSKVEIEVLNKTR